MLLFNRISLITDQVLIHINFNAGSIHYIYRNKPTVNEFT